MSERVDAHQHLWRYNKEEYGWIGKEMSTLAKDFLPSELERQLARSEIRGSIAVQARRASKKPDGYWNSPRNAVRFAES